MTKKSEKIEVVITKSSLYPLIMGLVAFFLITRFIGHIDHLGTLQEAWRYVVSGGKEMITWPETVISQVMLMLAYAVIGVFVALAANVAATILIGKRKGEYGIFDIFPKGKTVNSIFLIILAEELFARLLCQGIIGNWLGAPFVVGIIGNTIWAAIHITNWPKEDRQFGRTLPQFAGGLLIMMPIYAVAGFWWATFAHFTYDAILFAMTKRADDWTAEIAWIIYHAIVAGILGLVVWLAGINLTSIMPWLTTTSVITRVAMSSLQIWVAITFIDAVLDLGLAVMGYDINAAMKSSFGYVLGEIVGAAFIYINLWIWMWVGRLFGWSPFEVAMAITFAGILLTKIDTPSSMARAWFRLPITYLIVAVVMTQGFWTTVAMLVGWGLLNIVPNAIREVVRKQAVAVISKP